MPPLDPKEWIVQVNVQVNESRSLKHSPSVEQQFWEKRSIYRVPARVTKLNSEAYRPQAVSFGPYHYNEDHLRPMEDHKHCALLHFLRRSGKPVEPFLRSLKEVVVDLVASYEALDPTWKKDIIEDPASQFLQLMITDGCFMLEILRFVNGDVDDYAPNDPIFSKHGVLHILPVIRRDMLLLENQLPMLVLERLVAVCDGNQEDEYINRLILHFYSPSSPNNNPSMGKCLHVLDVFGKNLVQPTQHTVATLDSQNNARMGACLPGLDIFGKRHPMEPKKNKKRKSKGAYDLIPSATELRELGIQFKESDTNSLKGISFTSGVLRLPMIAVNNTTESMFLNLIAFQRSHVGAVTEVWAGTELTSYICLMDNLIDKGPDVVLLRKKGIIENYLESDEAAAKLFNSLAKDMMLSQDGSLLDVMSEVREYCKKRRHKWRANLMHTYFRNPWVILSLIAAFFLFVLTTIQTVYTWLSYQK